jgi:hypothetical protein
LRPPYEEFELTDSAYRHGFNDEDFAEVLRGRHLIVRCRRGKMIGYEVFGRNRGGAYLLAAGRVVQLPGRNVFRVFHLDRMSAAERRRFIKWLK